MNLISKYYQWYQIIRKLQLVVDESFLKLYGV